MRRLLLAATLLAASAGPARAEMAVLANGQVLKVSAHRAENGLVFLALKGGGEIGLPAADLRGIVPDEVMDEIAPALAAGGDIRALATEAARRHGLDPELVLAVIGVESAFNPVAVSPKGAQGLMQLMPGTARELGVKDPLDPAQNVDGGARYLSTMVERHGGDLPRALAAYNAGPGAVKRHKGIPPYKETQRYVQKVLNRYEASRPPAAPAAPAPPAEDSADKRSRSQR